MLSCTQRLTAFWPRCCGSEGLSFLHQSGCPESSEKGSRNSRVNDELSAGLAEVVAQGLEAASPLVFNR